MAKGKLSRTEEAELQKSLAKESELCNKFLPIKDTFAMLVDRKGILGVFQVHKLLLSYQTGKCTHPPPTKTDTLLTIRWTSQGISHQSCVLTQ